MVRVARSSAGSPHPNPLPKGEGDFFRVALWLWVLFLLTGLGVPATAAETASKSGKAPAIEAKPKDPQAERKNEDQVYELQKLLVDTLDQVQRNYVKEVDRRKLVEAAIKGVLSELDPYSTYISPDELKQFESSVESEFGGIGITISTDDGQLRVLSPLVGTPAYRAGMISGDALVEIDGKNTADLSLDDAVKQLKGEVGSKVTLVVIHPGQTERKTVTLTREVVHVPTVLGDRRKDDDSWDFLYDHPRKIAYVRITGFSRDTGEELKQALQELTGQGMKALILDLRFNPGGLLSSAIEVSDLFVSEGRIVSTKGRNSAERIWNAHKEGTFEGFPMVVLVNRYSASASEIVSACLQDHQRAVIMGERTWGKGSVQNVIPLEENHSALKLTTAAYKRPSGKNIHRFPGAKETDEWGVMPDKGFLLRLSDEDLVAQMDDRRQRDILLPKKPGGSSQADASTGLPSKPAVGDPGKAKPDAAKPPAASAEKKDPPATESRTLDRQLQMALDYLKGKLGN
jgi:carboxyl-terminal processing protease